MKIYRPSRKISGLALNRGDFSNWLKPPEAPHAQSQSLDERLYSKQGFIRGISKLNKIKSIHYGFSTRKFGNMGFKYGEYKEVLGNRIHFLKSAGLKLDEIVFMKPNHGSIVEVVGLADRGKGALDIESGVGPADALITFEKKVALGLNSADCVPLIITSKSKSVLALIHAGRGSTDSRIVGKVIRRLVSSGIDPKELIAGIGPAVQKNCYKLDYLETESPTMWLPWVMPQYKQVKVLIEKNEIDGLFKIRAERGKIIVDIVGYNIQQLIEAGVDPKNIDIAPVCSTCFTKRGELFSHSLANLYDKSHLYPDGRFMAVAMLK